MQAEVLFLVDLLRFDDPADEFLYLWDKPDENAGIDDVESGMESCQHKRQLGGVGRESCCADGIFPHVYVEAYPSAHHIYKWLEHHQYPQHAKHIEEHVGKSCTAGLCVGREGGEVRGDGGTDVLAKHQGDTLIDGQRTATTQNHRDGHDRCRRLHAERENSAKDQERQSGPERMGVEALEEAQHRLVVTQIHLIACKAQRSQTQQQQSQSKEEVTDIAVTLHVDEDDAKEEAHVADNADVERHTSGHNPCCQRRADVCTHDDRDCLRKGEQACIDKRYSHHGGGC